MLTDLAPAVKKELGITDARQPRLPQPLLLLHLLQNKERRINSKNKDLKSAGTPALFSYPDRTSRPGKYGKEFKLVHFVRISNIMNLNYHFIAIFQPDYKG